MVEAYMNAFLSCYPHKNIEVIPVKQRDRSLKFRVVIDHDRGDMLLSGDDLEFATRLLQRGR